MDRDDIINAVRGLNRIYDLVEDPREYNFWNGPVPPPTDEEVEAGRENNMSFSYEPGRWVCRVGPQTVMKCGNTRNLEMEFDNLEMLNMNPGLIPVPQLYGLSRQGDWMFIFMEYVDGETLEDCLPRLNPDEQLAIEQQIRQHYRSLRGLRQTRSTYYGADGNLPYIPRPRYQYLAGPYDHVEDFIQDFVPFEQYLIHSDFFSNEYVLRMVRNYRLDFIEAAGDTEPVFSHGDISLRNIIRRPDGSLCFVDWEHAGWYPPWYDYLSTRPHYPLQCTEPYPWLERIIQRCEYLSPDVDAVAAAMGNSFVNLANAVDQLARRHR
ncbi:kinase-like domain-containing protein [Xylariaceae sp. FL1272]|nr:kinase-like domain-containing protein [Xylariaceae sp. FL1272]